MDIKPLYANSSNVECSPAVCNASERAARASLTFLPDWRLLHSAGVTFRLQGFAADAVVAGAAVRTCAAAGQLDRGLQVQLQCTSTLGYENVS